MLKNKKVRLYEVRKDSMVYAISLVKDPAIESNFVYLSKEEPKQICLEKDEKHLVYGAVLIPNKPIYRNDMGEYYIQFPEDTIEQLAHHYLQEDNIYSFTTQHKDIADDVSIVESWIKTSESDKSVDLGIDAPIGTWFVGCKVENEEIWKGIKDGSMRGFSVESFLNFNELLSKINKDDMQEEKLEQIEVNASFWGKIKDIIVDALKSPSTPQTEAETTAEVVVADMVEETAVPTVEEPVVEETPMEEVVEEPVEVVEEPQQIAEDVVEEVVENAPNEEVAEESLQEVINELNAKIDELNVQIEELKKENVKLSKQPSAKPVSTRMSAQSESNFDRMLAIMNGSAFAK